MFDLPTDTSNDRKRYRKVVKVLESEGFYRFQYSIYVRVCVNFKDADLVKIRLRSYLANYPGEITALSLTDKQFTAMEQINWKVNNGSNQSLSASTKRMIVI